MKKTDKKIPKRASGVFPTKGIRNAAITLVLSVLVVIIVPPIFYAATSFSAESYYEFTGGIIAGLVTLFALAWQFADEREKTHIEKRIDSRGFFQANYYKGIVTSSHVEAIYNRCKVHTDKSKGKITNVYFIIRLHSEKCIYDCFVRFEGVPSNNIEREKETASVGLVVPNQTILIPVCLQNKHLKFSILYRTTMGETIKHQFEFNSGIDDPNGKETLYCKQSNDMINEESIDGLLIDDEFQEVFSSKGRLFLYND